MSNFTIISSTGTKHKVEPEILLARVLQAIKAGVATKPHPNMTTFINKEVNSLVAKLNLPDITITPEMMADSVLQTFAAEANDESISIRMRGGAQPSQNIFRWRSGECANNVPNSSVIVMSEREKNDPMISGFVQEFTEIVFEAFMIVEQMSLRECTKAS